MNATQLKEELVKEGIDTRYASLEGEIRDQSLVLERPESGGWCVYASERGQRLGEHWFITEEEACQYIFDSLSRDPLAKKRS
jgi:hypothetical protein